MSVSCRSKGTTPIIDWDSGIQRWGGTQDIYTKQLKSFSQYHLTPKTIRTDLSKGNLDSALQLTHSISGIAGNLSLLVLANDLKSLETEIDKITQIQLRSA